MKKARARLISLRKHPGRQSRQPILRLRGEYSPGGQKLSMGKNFRYQECIKSNQLSKKSFLQN
ncbi:hypothetical protein, partial [Escherichia coli]|uniref:hypothetical protein n=1 Tax=Escherichia coli TaxID=562 RepID=UPI001BB0509B